MYFLLLHATIFRSPAVLVVFICMYANCNEFALFLLKSVFHIECTNSSAQFVHGAQQASFTFCIMQAYACFFIDLCVAYNCLISVYCLCICGLFVYVICNKFLKLYKYIKYNMLDKSHGSYEGRSVNMLQNSIILHV